MNPEHISLKPSKNFILLLVLALETLNLCMNVFRQAFLLISPFPVPDLSDQPLFWHF